MEFLEKNLEDIIFESPNSELQKRGLRIYGKKLRQVRIGNYGVADLITIQRHRQSNGICENVVPIIYDNDNVICEACKNKICRILDEPIVTIYEFKKGAVDMNSFDQLIRYYNGIHTYFYDHRRAEESDRCIEIRMVLIGSSINLGGSLCYLPDIIDNLTIYTYDYKYNGIVFKSEYGYSLIDKGF